MEGTPRPPMGQQQLLLVVLGIVIVGLAVAVGIQAFDENRRETRRDVAVAAAIRYAGDVMAWYDRVPAMGGGGGSWENFGLDRIGYTPDGTCSNNRPYIELPDGSHLAVNASIVEGQSLAAWLPNGDCEEQWKWVFHIYIQNATVTGVEFIGCNANDSRYPWTDGSQCPDW